MNSLVGNASINYPDNNIDPKLKGYEWILQYIKAADAEGQTYFPALQGSLFYRRLQEIRTYAMGKQPINKYKTRLPSTSIGNQSEANLSFDVVPVICRFREIIISRLLQREYDITCYAIDPLSSQKEDEEFRKQQIKLMMRQKAMQVNSPIANLPILKKREGEPDDMAELMMLKKNYKEQMCFEAEEGIQLVRQQNNFSEKRKRTIENLVDYGIGGYIQDIDENGKVTDDEAPFPNMLLSYCEKNDFSDLNHWGVYKQWNLADLSPYFSPSQMDEIQKNVAGKNNNPNPPGMFVRNWTKYKVRVLTCKFLTWNTYVYKKEIDSKSNQRFGRTDYKNTQFIAVKQEDKGEPKPVYSSVTKQMVYKGSWICDTNMMFDYGLAENQSRKKSSWAETNLDIQLYAWNFNNMMFTGITERLIPIADAYQLAWEKLQNLKAKLIPYLIDIDLDAVDSAVFGGGGQKLKKEEIMDFIFSNFIVLTRKRDLINGNPNYKTVTIQSTGMLDAFVQIYQDLQNCMSMLYDISGLNQITAAATPNPRTLVPGYENANISTDNALALIAFADKDLMRREADNVFCKLQIAVKLGKVEGLYRPLGSETVKFLSINPDIRLIEMGIFIDDAPTLEERNLFFQEMMQDEQAGLIEPQDRVRLRGFRNLKQAYDYLAYIIEKRKQERMQAEMAKIDRQNQGVTNAGIAVEKEKQKTLIMQHQFNMQELYIKGQIEFQTELMKKNSDQTESQIQAQAKVLSSKILADAKKAVQATESI